MSSDSDETADSTACPPINSRPHKRTFRGERRLSYCFHNEFAPPPGQLAVLKPVSFEELQEVEASDMELVADDGEFALAKTLFSEFPGQADINVRGGLPENRYFERYNAQD